MTDAKRKMFQRLERDRMIRYQHQHRGLRFLRLWLPPTTDRKVHIIGLNNHIYRGKIPAVPLDELPPGVDPESIDEEQLYKEIRDMRFPEVPPQEPLGPTRRVGGEYTKAKRMAFAPVVVHTDDRTVETPIVGADGRIYKGTSKDVPVFELDRKLRGTKRPIRKPTLYSSSRGVVTPTVVSLYVDGKPPCERKPPVPLIELPYVDLNKMIELMGIKNPELYGHITEDTKSKHSEAGSSNAGDEVAEESEQKEEDVGSSEPDESSDTTDITSSETTESESVGEKEISDSEPEAEGESAGEKELPDSEPDEAEGESVAEELPDFEPEEAESGGEELPGSEPEEAEGESEGEEELPDFEPEEEEGEFTGEKELPGVKPGKSKREFTGEKEPDYEPEETAQKEPKPESPE